MHETRVLTFVSRRQAGVWTNLPSIAMSILRRVERSSIVCIDLGHRYEMLNHFGVSPSAFPAHGTVADILSRGDVAERLPTSLVSYSDLVSRAVAKSPDSLNAAYVDCVARMDQAFQTLYLMPLQVPPAPAHDPYDGAFTAALEALIETLAVEVQPLSIWVTFEGQPEARLFAPILTQNVALRWSLDRCDHIVSLVRHDSTQRFFDGVPIPELIGREQGWRKKLRIVLTRSEGRVRPSAPVAPLLLGTLPYLDGIGRAVSAGRIPFLDLLLADVLDPDEKRYLIQVNAIASALASA